MLLNAHLQAVSGANAPRMAALAPSPWYCIQTERGPMGFAIREIESRGFQVFWPRFWATNKRHQPVARSLFGPYCFVSFDKTDPAWRTIHKTPGVRRVISHDAERPCEVPQAAIQKFIDDLGPNGLRPYESGVRSFSKLVPGAAVKITIGPLAGLTGVYARPVNERVAVLLSMLGGQVAAVMDRESVEAA